MINQRKKMGNKKLNDKTEQKKKQGTRKTRNK